jgi:hypothetical protein
MMVYSETIDTAGTFTYSVGCTFSTNLVDWSPTQRLWTPESAEVLYLTLTAPLVADVSFDQKSVPGDEVHLYVTRSVAGNGGNRWSDATVDRHVITIRSLRSLFDEVDALAADLANPEDWTTVSSLSNSWASVTGDPVRYRKHAGTGYMHLPVLTGGATGSVLFTLPAGYRPDSLEDFQAWTTADGSAYAYGTVRVEATGTGHVRV